MTDKIENISQLIKIRKRASKLNLKIKNSVNIPEIIIHLYKISFFNDKICCENYYYCYY